MRYSEQANIVRIIGALMDEAHLKDFFAGLAMLGLLVSEDFRSEDDIDISATAYQLADAMMEARYDSQYRKEMEVNGEY